MKQIFTLIVLIGLALGAYAQMPVVGKVEYKTMPSKILNQEREYAVYLPKSYTTDPDKKYPVLYLLHGGGGSHIDWPEKGRLVDVANPLMDSGDATEMIIVCPEAGKTFMNYFNNPDWRYEDYFFQELVPFIEANYRVVGDKNHRAVAGLSMGGGGTIVYASHHPELFCAAYSMSGYLYRHDNLFWINFNDPVQKKIHQLVEDNNCVKLVKNAGKEKVDAMKTVKWFIDCGDDDFTFKANVEFVLAMGEAGIPCQFRVRDGGHTWEYWHTALYQVLPFVSNSFSCK
jgi:enterochelin esterase-like enzyme